MNVAIIPARGGSVRIPKKNIKIFHGKPIIAYSIEAAKASGLFESVIVSTEDEEIADISRQYGAEVMMRPEWLTTDEFGPLDVARHCLGLLPAVDKVCVIYATTPMLDLDAMERGYRKVQTPGFGYSFSIGIEPLHDAAQFFWCKPWALLDRIPEFGPQTIMVPVDPMRDIDINTPDDWAKAEKMYDALQCA